MTRNPGGVNFKKIDFLNRGGATIFIGKAQCYESSNVIDMIIPFSFNKYLPTYLPTLIRESILESIRFWKMAKMFILVKINYRFMRIRIENLKKNVASNFYLKIKINFVF